MDPGTRLSQKKQLFEFQDISAPLEQSLKLTKLQTCKESLGFSFQRLHSFLSFENKEVLFPTLSHPHPHPQLSRVAWRWCPPDSWVLIVTLAYPLHNFPYKSPSLWVLNSPVVMRDKVTQQASIGQGDWEGYRSPSIHVQLYL